MKHNYLKHLFTVLLLLCTTVATAHDFEVDGIYYNILSPEDKTVMVTFKGTSYSEYSNEYSGSVVIPETVTMSETVTTVLNTFDTWTSTNKNNSTTSQTSYTLNVEAGNILKFDCSVSSESYYDWLIITLDGTEIVKKSGTLSGSYEKTFDTAGSHTLVVTYTKDSSQSSGNDEGKIYNITLSGVGSVNDVVYRVTSIGERAFYGCTGLTSIVIPNSVTSIGDYAFKGCTGLTSITIPNSVTSIGNDAFRGCSGLTSIVIPNSVTSIGDYVFAYCSGLTSIIVESGNMYYDSRDNCNAIIETSTNTLLAGCQKTIIPNDVTSIGTYAFYSCTGLKSIVIPNSVTSIGNEAFRGCSGLTSITIGNSVTSIEEYAFYSCSGLKTVINLSNLTFSEGSTNNGYIAFYADKVINAPNGYFDGDYIWAEINGVNTLLYYLGNATEINLPADYKGENYVIGEKAFYGCTGLTRVEICNGVTSIGNYAFEGCSNIETLYISSTIKSIGDKAFAGCEKITEIKVALEKPIRGSADIFADAVYDNATLYIPNGTEQLYQKREPWNIFFYIVEMDFTGIDEVYDEVKGESGKQKGVCYDLSGRVVENTTTGIYIIGSKKVLIK